MLVLSLFLLLLLLLLSLILMPTLLLALSLSLLSMLTPTFLLLFLTLGHVCPCRTFSQMTAPGGRRSVASASSRGSSSSSPVRYLKTYRQPVTVTAAAFASPALVVICCCCRGRCCRGFRADGGFPMHSLASLGGGKLSPFVVHVVAPSTVSSTLAAFPSEGEIFVTVAPSKDS